MLNTVLGTEIIVNKTGKILFFSIGERDNKQISRIAC